MAKYTIPFAAYLGHLLLLSSAYGAPFDHSCEALDLLDLPNVRRSWNIRLQNIIPSAGNVVCERLKSTLLQKHPDSKPFCMPEASPWQKQTEGSLYQVEASFTTSMSYGAVEAQQDIEHAIGDAMAEKENPSAKLYCDSPPAFDRHPSPPTGYCSGCKKQLSAPGPIYNDKNDFTGNIMHRDDSTVTHPYHYSCLRVWWKHEAYQNTRWTFPDYAYKCPVEGISYDVKLM